MLILALGVLALLVVLGTAFAQIMRLERKATENYIEALRMDMLLDSALDRVVAELLGGANYKSFSEYGVATPPRWINKLPDGDLANGRVSLEDDRSDRVWKWEVFAEQLGQTYAYKTRVIDCSAQINLNGRQDTLARMLDNLGRAIDRSSRLKLSNPRVVNPLYTGPNRTGDQVRGANIIQVRRRLPGGKFTSKSQLKQIIGPENYEIIKDFVTVHSWEDPYTYKPTDGMDEVVDPMLLGATGLGGGGRALGGGGTQFHPEVEMTSARIAEEPRHPINVNTAPEEVLIACLEEFGCRRPFPYSSLAGLGGSLVPVDQNAMILGERIVAQEEYRDVRPRLIYVYTPRLQYDHAKKIAEKIVRDRQIKPFMTWRTNNEVGQVGFEDWIDQLDASYFPPPDLCQAVDSDMPMNTQLNSLIKSPQSPVGIFWLRGHGVGTVSTLRRQYGLPMHQQYAWYYDTIKGGLKANFNPNTRLNRCNPNPPAFNPVDKSDLVTLRTPASRELVKGYSTEFCFDTNGVYEVTILARIARNPLSAPGVTGVGPAAAANLDRPDYEKKQVAVVKVFDVLRHTSQFHFEKNFTALSYSSRNNRKYVVTWPEPMAALSELHTSGSLRDGRIELAGINDGQRLQMTPQMRYQYYASFPSVLAAVGFQDRRPASYAKLKRLSTSRALAVGIMGDEYTNALKEVLNCYSRSGPRYEDFYSRVRMQAAQVFTIPAAQWYDPLVEKEVMGTDLYPDGLSTSILRMTHLQSRHLVLPARGRLGGGEGSGGNPRVGESLTQGNNSMGNVPYYKGGIAFWVKFEFDGNDPVFSGLMGCTQVIRQVPFSATDYRGGEGTQFFIFKNSVGQLRVVRMYYHQAFLGAGGTGEGSDESMGYRLFPDPGIRDPAGGGAGALENPILEYLDPKKLVARSDVVVDVRHFKAHEWHHIAVEWDDENVGWPIRIFVDFKELNEAVPRLAQATRDATPRCWVRLNERQPKDRWEIGGIVREQGVADAGIFKWFTNTARPEGGGVGVQVVAQNIKRLIANATIDEVITFEGSFLTARAYYGGRAAVGYYSVQPGEYANSFDIPLPPDVDYVVLRTFDWTSYYPVFYTDSRPGSVPQPFAQKQPIMCQVAFRSDLSPPSEFSEPWRQPTVPNRVAGRRAFKSSAVESRNKAEFVYRFTIHGARATLGTQAGGVVQTPAIDDVTLTYFLPHPKVLLVEEED